MSDNDEQVIIDEALLARLVHLRTTAANWDDLPEWSREGVTDGISLGNAAEPMAPHRLAHINACANCVESRMLVPITTTILSDCLNASEDDYFELNPEWAIEGIEDAIIDGQAGTLVKPARLRHINACIRCNFAVNRKARAEESHYGTVSPATPPAPKKKRSVIGRRYREANATGRSLSAKEMRAASKR